MARARGAYLLTDRVGERQRLLGVLGTLGYRTNNADNWRAAVVAYRAGLAIRTRDKEPEQWQFGQDQVAAAERDRRQGYRDGGDR